MSEGIGQPLLAPSETPPARIYNPNGASPFLLLGDHAGNAVPAALGSLGLERTELDRHIGWDLGVADLGRSLANLLDAPFISQAYSRLVVDCNRNPDRAEAIADVSDGTSIPGNRGISLQDRLDRVAAIHQPYHNAVARVLANRDYAGCQSILVSLHSFTPTMAGFARPWEIGVLYERGRDRLAQALLQMIRKQREIALGDNEPYAMDESDYTIPHHAYPADRLCVELEIRQDLLSTRHDRERWAATLCGWLNASSELVA